jgi:hypothetical protein
MRKYAALAVWNELISAYVARVDVKRDHLSIQLSAQSERDGRWHSEEQDERVHRDPQILVVPWKKTSTGQESIDCGLHQGRRQERERYRHIDLTNGAVLSGSDLLNIRDLSCDQLVEPVPPLRDRGDERGTGYVWSYAGFNSFGRDRATALSVHPTMKPVALVADALRDCSKRGEIVLDPFGGSGTTMIAAERSGRAARLIEIDPIYCDVIVRRWQTLSGKTAVLSESDETWAEVEGTRRPVDGVRE